jgi:cytoskeletal protein CcmA (bactofilin family)
VSIGRSGTVKGQIKGRNVVVSGLVEGQVEAEFLEILSTGRLAGQHSSSQFLIDPGGQFEEKDL